MNQTLKHLIVDSITAWDCEEDQADSVVFLKKVSISRQASPSPLNQESSYQALPKKVVKNTEPQKVRHHTRQSNRLRSQKEYLLQFMDTPPNQKPPCQTVEKEEEAPKRIQPRLPQPLYNRSSGHEAPQVTSQSTASLQHSRMVTESQSSACRLFTGHKGNRVSRKNRHFRTKILKSQVLSNAKISTKIKPNNENFTNIEQISDKNNRRHLKFPLFYRQTHDFPPKSTAIRQHRKLKTAQNTFYCSSVQSSQFADDKLLQDLTNDP